MATRRATLSALSATLAVGAGCLDGGSGTAGETTGDRETITTTSTDMTPEITTEFALDSPSFTDGGAIPSKFTCDGTDVSPELTIGGVPDEAETLALIVDDPDAPGGTFDHWLLWNVPADTIHIPEGIKRGESVASLSNARQGMNDFNTVGYRGPCPPKGDGAHRYRFTMYACDRELDVPPGAKKDELQSAVDAAQVARSRITGTYERS
jgi:Raf kinase inhibitor-like YbhB/YbcL family protein